MKFSIVSCLLCAALATCAPHEVDQRDRAVAAAARLYAKRQNGDYSELLQLASIAGVPVPTDNPGLLLSIAPLAASLNALLPTAPVLEVLETAAPPGLLSSLVHDPAFAASWIASFEQGPSPSWFLALPTSIRSYLHTYADGGNLVAAATAVAGIASVESAASSQMSASAASASSASITAMSGMGANNTAMATQSTSGSGSGSGSGSTASSTGASQSLSSSVSLAGAAAARETGVLAAAAVGMAGILGLAVAL